MSVEGITPDEFDAQDAVERLFNVLAPGLADEAAQLEKGNYRLVHYTSAENALNILKSGEFWLRNVRCMNDFSEIQHGIRMLQRTFNENEEARLGRLKTILDKVAEGAAQLAIDAFNSWVPSLPHDTFIGCLSVFDVEDVYGRLSMWRAYSSKQAGVALVMNSQPFLADTDDLKAYSIPVAYLSDTEFALGIDRCLDALENTVGFLNGLNSESVQHTVFWWLICLAVGLKHPAFHEEMERRIIYIPSMDRSPVIQEDVVSIGGLPQIVQKIPLKNDPATGLFGADIPSLINKILIGPTEFPLVIRDAFVSALTSKGVQNAAERVTISFIPLR